VLYVEGQPEAAGYLHDALARQGIEVSVAAPVDIPESAAAFALYDGGDPERCAGKGDRARENAGDRVLRARWRRWISCFAAGENVYGEQGY